MKVKLILREPRQNGRVGRKRERDYHEARAREAQLRDIKADKSPMKSELIEAPKVDKQTHSGLRFRICESKIIATAIW
jgi:hypothetical protein